MKTFGRGPEPIGEKYDLPTKQPNKPKQTNIFGQVLAAILVAAAIFALLYGIYALRSQIQATSKATSNLQKEMAKSDAMLRVLNSSESPSPSP